MRKTSGFHRESHRLQRSGWLRAAVLGANDGIISTASLLMGIAAAGMEAQIILLTGVAGLVAGAMSMAAGEYVSVSSQADVEAADLRRESRELEMDPAGELRELQDIYVGRGLTPELAKDVAHQLMAHNALEAHARDELGITDITIPRPLQAALISALSFSGGACVPLAAVLLASLASVALTTVIAAVSLLALVCLGGLAARIGGAGLTAGALRVGVWGATAMVVTALIGHWFGVAL